MLDVHLDSHSQDLLNVEKSKVIRDRKQLSRLPVAIAGGVTLISEPAWIAREMQLALPTRSRGRGRREYGGQDAHRLMAAAPGCRPLSMGRKRRAAEQDHPL